jgi:hypothetical protein
MSLKHKAERSLWVASPRKFADYRETPEKRLSNYLNAACWGEH